MNGLLIGAESKQPHASCKDRCTCGQADPAPRRRANSVSISVIIDQSPPLIVTCLHRPVNVFANSWETQLPISIAHCTARRVFGPTHEMPIEF
jgi:hypothetical protein